MKHIFSSSVCRPAAVRHDLDQGSGCKIANSHIFDPYAGLVVIVIVLVPIAVPVPAVVVFIPPLMPLTPAPFSRIVQFTTLVICLFAVASMFLNGLVEFMFRVSDSALTPVEVFCVESWHCREKQYHGQ